MNYVIVDLEATCWEGPRKAPNEIIEIGAVLVKDQAEVVSAFEQFVRPHLQPQLSDFCTSLTSIRQSEVDDAPLFPEAIERFTSWFGYGQADYLLCSWGFYARHQFAHDCKLHGMRVDWLESHISLKHQYARMMELKRPIGMKSALHHEKLTLEGTHHRGIDDARNIARIIQRHFDRWERP